MAETAVATTKATDKKKMKNIIIIVVIILLVIAAIAGYYFFVYKPGQLKGLPTSKEGLAPGAKWNNNGKLEIVA